MSNICSYTMKAVAEKEETLKRLLDIMNYKDEEFFIDSCNYAHLKNSWEENGLIYYEIEGSVDGSCKTWFETEENKKNKLFGKEAHYVTVDLLCKKLNMGVELYANDHDIGFEQWFVCDRNGEFTKDEEDDEVGVEGYGVFMDARDIWEGNFIH